MALSEPQKIWLSAHPHRSAKWLRERIADGFDVHHIDGDDTGVARAQSEHAIAVLVGKPPAELSVSHGGLADLTPAPPIRA